MMLSLIPNNVITAILAIVVLANNRSNGASTSTNISSNANISTSSLSSAQVAALSDESHTISCLRSRLRQFGQGSGVGESHSYRIGLPIPCTYEEKVCLSYGTLFDPEKGRCLLSQREWCHFVPIRLRGAITEGTGHLFAMCQSVCSLPGSLKDNNGCSIATAIRGITCNCKGQMQVPQPLPFGGHMCRCEEYGLSSDRRRRRRDSPDLPPMTTPGSQPDNQGSRLDIQGPQSDSQGSQADSREPRPENGTSRAGSCVLSELVLPWTAESPLNNSLQQRLLAAPLALRCNDRQLQCFARGKVWVSQRLGCQPLLRTNTPPCAAGQVLALSASAAATGTLQVQCVPRFGACTKGAKRMLFDGLCHRKRELALISVSRVQPTLFGQYYATSQEGKLLRRLRTSLKSNRTDLSCLVYHTFHPTSYHYNISNSGNTIVNSTTSRQQWLKEPPSSTTESDQLMPGLAPQQTNSTPAAVGVKGYRRYHAKDSYIGAPIPCSPDEKICFRFNTLYHPAAGRCLHLEGNIDNPILVDDQELLHRSGHLVAKQRRYKDPCPGYRMAYDGVCYPKQLVRAVLCGCAAEPTPHFLGGVECRCAPATPISVEQPTAHGHCRIPDLRFPDNNRDSLFPRKWMPSSTYIGCAPQQLRCFSKGMLWMRTRAEEAGGCFRLHSRGPCPDNHTVVLSRGNFLLITSECKPDCPAGYQRLSVDGKCHNSRLIQVAQPPDAIEVLNVFGELQMTSRITDISLGASENSCEIKSIFSSSSTSLQDEPWKTFASPPCGMGNNNMCLLYEVQNQLPTAVDFEE